MALAITRPHAVQLTASSVPQVFEAPTVTATVAGTAPASEVTVSTSGRSDATATPLPRYRAVSSPNRAYVSTRPVSPSARSDWRTRAVNGPTSSVAVVVPSSTGAADNDRPVTTMGSSATTAAGASDTASATPAPEVPATTVAVPAAVPVATAPAPSDTNASPPAATDRTACRVTSTPATDAPSALCDRVASTYRSALWYSVPSPSEEQIAFSVESLAWTLTSSAVHTRNATAALNAPCVAVTKMSPLAVWSVVMASSWQSAPPRTRAVPTAASDDAQATDPAGSAGSAPPSAQAVPRFVWHERTARTAIGTADADARPALLPPSAARLTSSCSSVPGDTYACRPTRVASATTIELAVVLAPAALYIQPSASLTIVAGPLFMPSILTVNTFAMVPAATPEPTRHVSFPSKSLVDVIAPGLLPNASFRVAIILSLVVPPSSTTLDVMS